MGSYQVRDIETNELIGEYPLYLLYKWEIETPDTYSELVDFFKEKKGLSITQIEV